MGELCLLVTVTSRNLAGGFLRFYESKGLSSAFVTVGRGTAASEVLEFFGLESSEKSILFHLVTTQTFRDLKPGLRWEQNIDLPGSGIAFLIPLSSVGGKKTLAYFTDGQSFHLGEESTLKETKYELLVVIANQGYTEMIMDAAREVHATGGTVLHARGTGREKAEQFLGVTLVDEKEMIFIVVDTKRKREIMSAIMEKAGLGTKARSIVFSLPVTDIAGMRLAEEMEG